MAVPRVLLGGPPLRLPGLTLRPKVRLLGLYHGDEEPRHSLAPKRHRLLQYLDDFLFLSASLAGARAALRRVLDDFDAAGLLLSWNKCQLAPTRRLKHLGFIVDSQSMRFEAPPDRWERFQRHLTDVLAAGSASARSLASLTGQLMSFGPAFGRFSYMYSRQLSALVDSASSWQARLPLSSGARQELTFWRDIPRDRYTSPILRPPSRPALTLHTDASDHGWGAVLLERHATASDYLPSPSRTESSTARELYAVLASLRSLVSQLRGHEIALYSDSQTTVRILEKGGSPRLHLHSLALDIFHFCLHERITLCPHWLPREDNQEADALSRRPHSQEWQLHPRFFQVACRAFGTPAADLFASTHTRQLPRFYSEHWCPDTSGVDAFRVDWSLFSLSWVNPPFSLLPRALAKLIADGARAAVLVPLWPSRPWWPLLAPDGLHWGPLIRGVVRLPTASDLFLSPLDAPSSSPPTSRSFAILLVDPTGATPDRLTGRGRRCIWPKTCRCFPV